MVARLNDPRRANQGKTVALCAALAASVLLVRAQENVPAPATSAAYSRQVPQLGFPTPSIPADGHGWFSPDRDVAVEELAVLVRLKPDTTSATAAGLKGLRYDC